MECFTLCTQENIHQDYCQNLCNLLHIGPSQKFTLCHCFRVRIGGKLEKKVAASVLGSRVAADDPASCQVEHSSIAWNPPSPLMQVCDCLPTREGAGYYLCYQVGCIQCSFKI